MTRTFKKHKIEIKYLSKIYVVICSDLLNNEVPNKRMVFYYNDIESKDIFEAMSKAKTKLVNLIKDNNE